MSTDGAAVGSGGWLTDKTAILLIGLLLAMPAVVVLDTVSGGNLRLVFLTTLAVGFLPPYVYSKLPQRYSLDRAVPWGLAVAVVILAVDVAVWATLRGVLGPDGSSIVAFLVVLVGCLALVRTWEPTEDD